MSFPTLALGVWATFATIGLLQLDDAQKRAEKDHTCLATRLDLAQATADLARTEGDLARIDEEEECDLACAALERHRDVLMSEIRDYYKTLREHSCGTRDE